MRKFQILALTLITCVAFTAVANAEVSLVYYPADANSPAWGENAAGTLIANSSDRSITTLEIISAGGNFTPAGAAAGAFAPPFDIISETKLFKLSAGAGAYTNLNFGTVVKAGLGGDALVSDMSINGSLTPDGSGNNALDAQGLSVVVVPEPASVALIGIGLLGLLSFRRKR